MTAEHVPFRDGAPPSPPPGAVASTPPAVNPPPNGHTTHNINMQPGHVAPSLEVQLASDPKYSEYLAWKASQEKGGTAPPAEEPKVDTEAPAPITDPKALLDMVDSAAQSDPVLAAQVNLLNSAVPGLDLQRAIGNALVYGNASLVDIAYIKEKAGDKAAHVETLAKSLVTYSLDAANRAVKSVYDVAGGEAQWASATAAFNKSAPQHLKVVVGELMNSGNANSIAAAAKTVVEFAKGSGAVPDVSGAIGINGAAAPASAQALSKNEFQAELRKLDPNSRDYLEVRENLFARRRMGQQLNK